MGDVFPEIGGEPVATFNAEELSAIITVAHARGVKTSVSTVLNTAREPMT